MTSPSGLTRRSVFLAAPLALAGGAAAAQGMMDHVDLAAPRMSAAELSRADLERLIAAKAPDTALDLRDRSLNGLDLSGLDLSGADLRWARLNRARLVGTRLDR
ncbi:MAG: pentapeptide repeat-containing protein, partial [Geminicoccaceae bacterium]